MAVDAVDYRRVRLDPVRRTVTFDDPRTRVDLSSVAKGAALDAALQTIQAAGVEGALLDAGGELALWDRRGRAVDLAVAHPATREDFVAGLSLCNQAVSTSGQGEPRLWIGGRPIGHLFDLASGLPVPAPLTSLSVIAPTALLADLYSTVGFLLGPCRASTFLAHRPGVAWLWAIGEEAAWEPAHPVTVVVRGRTFGARPCSQIMVQ
jgi:thiamine biosynthesis lipoprotein